MNRMIAILALTGVGVAHAAGDWSILGADRHNKIVLVDAAKGGSGTIYRTAGPKTCPGPEKCVAWFWTDKAKVPTKIYGRSDEARLSLRAKYTVESGMVTLYFDCNHVKGESNCFPGSRRTP